MYGDAAFCGTSAECADYLECTTKQFLWGFDRYRKYKKHRIERQITETDTDWIRKWDEFVTPLREKYGIPVYKATEGRGMKR
jgi:hypothetical protein